MAHNSLPPESCDVCVVGAGLNGAAAALSLAREGFTVTSVGSLERNAPGRTVALFGRSIDLLRRLGVWDAVEAAAAPMRTLRLIDDTGSLFAARPVEFRCEEIKLENFGWNIENTRLADILDAAMREAANLTRIDKRVQRFAFQPDIARLTLDDDSRIEARLVVGADGRASPTRKAAGLTARVHAYGQTALTLFLSHSRPHEDASTEFHTREGPFTLVPLPPGEKSSNRSSLVWVMSDAEGRRRAALADGELEREIERQARGLLGSLRIEGARGAFPMVRQSVAKLAATRVALVGDAAHAFPPIGAQGLNLGLRDVEGIVASARAARDAGEDIGAPEALSRYARARTADIAQRTFAVNALNLSLLADLAPVDALRGFGLTALRLVAPLRRAVMREGVRPWLGRQALS